MWDPLNFRMGHPFPDTWTLHDFIRYSRAPRDRPACRRLSSVFTRRYYEITGLHGDARIYRPMYPSLISALTHWEATFSAVSQCSSSYLASPSRRRTGFARPTPPPRSGSFCCRRPSPAPDRPEASWYLLGRSFSAAWGARAGTNLWKGACSNHSGDFKCAFSDYSA